MKMNKFFAVKELEDGNNILTVSNVSKDIINKLRIMVEFSDLTKEDFEDMIDNRFSLIRDNLYVDYSGDDMIDYDLNNDYMEGESGFFEMIENDKRVLEQYDEEYHKLIELIKYRNIIDDTTMTHVSDNNQMNNNLYHEVHGEDWSSLDPNPKNEGSLEDLPF